jgi:DNA-directed RNA polymerase subunit RPC12/RpoP
MVTAICEACGHKADVNIDQLHEETYVPNVARRLVCSKCGSKRINTRPAWHRIKLPWQGR